MKRLGAIILIWMTIASLREAWLAAQSATNAPPATAVTPATNKVLANMMAAVPVIEPLAWDALIKEVTARTGDTNVVVTFWATNTAATNVEIRAVRPSCGCTIAKLPSNPWVFPPGYYGPLEVKTDLRGKSGTLSKFLAVDTSFGFKLLTFRIIIPDSGNTGLSSDARGRNLMASLADRQAVFKGDCAQCHSIPSRGKKGPALYQAVCAICHEANHRASMVPDLCAVDTQRNRAYWKKWITEGKVGSLMPAFSKSAGGPLSDDQINSVVDYLLKRFALPATGNAPPAMQPALQTLLANAAQLITTNGTITNAVTNQAASPPRRVSPPLPPPVNLYK